MNAPAPLSPFSLLISEASPCGPDLELEGDRAFENFLLLYEGQIPRDYLDFKRESVDFASAFATGEKLLKRTLDVRLMVLLAQLSLLNRDLAGFTRWVGAIAWALSEFWEEVHPRGEDGDYTPRLSQLTSLEGDRVALRALKYAPLLESEREGALSYRAHLVLTGKEKPNVKITFNPRGEQEKGPEEKFLSEKAAERLLRDADQAKLAAICETLRLLAEAVNVIGAVTADKVGDERAVALPKLAALVADMAKFMMGELYKRDPSLAPAIEAPAETEIEPDEEDAGVSQAPSRAPGAFASLTEVDAALGAAVGYYVTREPSSPALLLIRQARETLGKNLYEVMKLLTPNYSETARVFVGPDSAYTVLVKSLAGAPSMPFERRDAPPAPDRASALALVDAVAAHMQRAEPSSPAPHLLQRARALATRDFLSLLPDVLPEEAIAALKKGQGAR